MTTADEIATDLAAALEAVRKVFDQLVAGIPGYDEQGAPDAAS